MYLFHERDISIIHMGIGYGGSKINVVNNYALQALFSAS
jgi:hypothetical protein